MNAQEGFEVLLKDRITPALRPEGYRRSAYTLRKFRGGCWGIINFQKSDSNTKDTVRFTVNLGVASEHLLRLESRNGHIPKRPAEPDCHWRARLGFLLPDRRDTWWTITAETDLEALSNEMDAHIRGAALPEMDRHLGDEILRDLLLTGRTPGVDEDLRLIYLIAFLRALGPLDRLDPIVNECRANLAERELPWHKWLLERALSGWAP